MSASRRLWPLVLVLAACTRDQSVVDPAGPQSRQIAQLFWAMTSAGSVIFAIVILMLALAMWRTRSGGEPRPLSWRQSRNLVLLAGVVVPSIVLFGFVFASAQADRASQARLPADALTIEVTGHQWWWEVHYVAPDGTRIATTANEIHLPVGRPLRVVLSSADVIHSFWTPNLAGKMDLIPGKQNVTWMQASQPGVYRGQCAEFCGLQHARMAFHVVAAEPAAFDAWLAHQARPAVSPSDERRRLGEQVFLRNQCVTCHAIRGTPAGGRLGPDLTHVGSRRMLAAGTLPNEREHLARWLLLPQAVKPGNFMPATVLPSQEFEALLDYLEGLE